MTKKTKKGKLLWIGDAACGTGFSVVTHELLDYLKEDWEVAVIGVNYFGDPHKYDYSIFPARPNERYDSYGIDRLKEVYGALKPDVVVILNDPWICAEYLPFLRAIQAKVVLYTLADGLHIKKTIAAKINDVQHIIAYTAFAETQFKLAGVTTPMSVCYHGLDVEFFKPLSKSKCRQELGLPEDLFIVGAVNRNQPRKRLDLTVQYFAEWAKDKPSNVKFYYHGNLRDIGWDIDDLMQYYGVGERLIVTSREKASVPRAVLPKIYNTFDVQVSTTQGEGFGLTQGEGMACGIPQIVPDWSALGEWCRFNDGTPAVAYVECTATAHTPDFVNAVGGIADKAQFIAALEKVYTDKQYRLALGEAGRKRVQHRDFNWKLASRHFDTVLTNVLFPKAAFVPQTL